MAKGKVKTVAFASQKGGAGKSTHCISLASSLHFLLKKKIAVIDCDFPQLSIKHIRAREVKELESDQSLMDKFVAQNMPAYPVEAARMELLPEVLEKLTAYDLDVILIDAPGTVNIENIRKSLSSVNHIFVPLEAEEMSLLSNIEFLKFIKEDIAKQPNTSLNSFHSFWNKVKTSAKKDLLESTQEYLRSQGYNVFESQVPDSVKFQRQVGRSTLFPSMDTIKDDHIQGLTREMCEVIFNT
jgi:cellulose biosynthesis protein BcsQ